LHGAIESFAVPNECVGELGALEYFGQQTNLSRFLGMVVLVDANSIYPQHNCL
jgi:hypothetical protein